MASRSIGGWCPLTVTETVTFSSCAVINGTVSYCGESSHYPSTSTHYTSTATAVIYGTSCPAPVRVKIPITIHERLGKGTSIVYVPSTTPAHTLPLITVTTTEQEPTITVTKTSTESSRSSSRPATHPTISIGECNKFAGVHHWGPCQYDGFCGYLVDGSVVSSNYADSMQSCVASCSHIEDCRYVNWSPHSEKSVGSQLAHNCFLWADAEKVVQKSDTWGAQKLSCESAIKAALPPSNPTQTTNPIHHLSTGEIKNVIHSSNPTGRSHPIAIFYPMITSLTLRPSECPEGHCSATRTSRVTRTVTKPSPEPETCPHGICKTTKTTLTTTTLEHNDGAHLTQTSVVSTRSTARAVQTISRIINLQTTTSRNKEPRFILRAHTAFGNRELFNNLYVQVPENSKSLLIRMIDRIQFSRARTN